MKPSVELATGEPLSQRALEVTVLVGAIPITTKHGDAILRGEVTGRRWANALSTVLVPHIASAQSGVTALFELVEASA